MEETERDQKLEALRLISIGESKFKESKFKSALKHVKKARKLSPSLEGLSSMLTAFKIVRVASKATSDVKDWYKILQVEPFSHINTIKKQYKMLALILHPDKNPYLGCEDAFKLVGEGFRVLSDKIRRKEYDMRLRIRLQEERVNNDDDNSVVVEHFWTACSRCRLLHQFERKYVGHVLVCPSCKKNFQAVEVEEKDKEDDGVEVGVRVSERLKRRKVFSDGGFGVLGMEREMGSLSSRVKVKPSGGEEVEELGSMVLRKKVGSGAQMGSPRVKGVNLKAKEGGPGKWNGGKLRKMSSVDEVLERTKMKKVKFADEMMTLAEMRLEAKRKALQDKEKLKENQKVATKNSMEKENDLKKLRDIKSKESEASKKSDLIELETRASLDKSKNLAIERHGTSRKNVSLKIDYFKDLRNGGLEIINMEYPNLYDFDRDRAEKSFKKGQVWAIYEDEGMPRLYGLVDEVVSVNPFVLRISWLDFLSNGNEGLTCWEKTGYPASFGRFKASGMTLVNSLNIFSHVVDCEREAREIYRIYPKKGSVWAVYNEINMGAEERNASISDIQCYEIALFLTTYSEIHGLSMAYLEKVDGFNSIFKRREVGSHAIRWLGKDDVWLLSHQIPARKLSGDEVPSLLKDCWELDPALLPSHLLTAD